MLSVLFRQINKFMIIWKPLITHFWACSNSNIMHERAHTKTCSTPDFFHTDIRGEYIFSGSRCGLSLICSSCIRSKIRLQVALSPRKTRSREIDFMFQIIFELGRVSFDIMSIEKWFHIFINENDHNSMLISLFFALSRLWISSSIFYLLDVLPRSFATPTLSRSN